MWKKMLAFLVIGLVAGGAIAFVSRGGTGVSGSGDDAVASLKRSVDALDRRVVELAAQVESLQRRSLSARAMPDAGGEAATAGAGGERAPRDPEAIRQAMEQRRAQFDPAAMIERRQQQELDRLVAAGFTRDRAEWIMRRTEELQVQAMQAQYEAQRSGRQAQGTDIEQQLRKELGEAEYERYLTATGRPTEVPVMGVLASSAAERSGLKPGDQIVSYAGTRVYDTRDLNQLTLAGSPGESVTLEVKRNGQSVQITVPRGPLGVQTGGPAGARGGPPGGFRGGR